MRMHASTTAQYAMPQQEAWMLMRRHRIKALPVVDRHMRILGIVTLADFMRHANIEMHGSMRERLHALLKHQDDFGSLTVQ